ncbi:Unknown protein, partial [Striga hermonthica]
EANDSRVRAVARKCPADARDLVLAGLGMARVRCARAGGMGAHRAMDDARALGVPDDERGAQGDTCEAQCENKQASLILLQLTGDARIWWNANWSMRPDKKEGCTWERFREIIREKYYPTYYRAEMERQFLSLKQGTCSVDEYEREFTRLAAFVPDLVCTEAQRAHRFTDGLYPAVRHNIVGHGAHTYTRAVSNAQEVDASIRREANRDRSQPSAPAQSSTAPS